MTEEDFETLVDKFWKLAEDGERGTGDAYNAILAAFAEMRAERDAALKRERVLREVLEDMLRLIEEHGDRIMKAHATRIIAARRALAGKEGKS